MLRNRDITLSKEVLIGKTILFFFHWICMDVHLGCPYMAWLSFIELEKAMIHRICLLFCHCSFSLSALWCSFSAPTICPQMSFLSVYHLTGVYLTLDVGYPLSHAGHSSIVECLSSATHCSSEFTKLSSGHKAWKDQFSFKSQWKAMPKSAWSTIQVHSSHMLVN